MSSSHLPDVDQSTAPRATNAQGLPQHQLHPGPDLVEYAKSYASEKPEIVALWCFGVGFILGWKLKPW